VGRVRLQRLNSLIGETVAELLVKKSKDPRLAMVTVTRAEVSPDLGKVRIFYSVMGDDQALAKAALALKGARGFVRASLYQALTLKRVPEVLFEHDRNLAYASRINTLIADLRRPGDGGWSEDGDDVSGDGDDGSGDGDDGNEDGEADVSEDGEPEAVEADGTGDGEPAGTGFGTGAAERIGRP
jgi:ribosome-binding factor A